MRQKLELSQVERETHIRARYLGALKEERFEVLLGVREFGFMLRSRIRG
jgi:cytoskeletal protein RodZ